MRRVFTDSDYQALGSNATEQDLPAEDLPPEYLTYDDDHDLDPDHGDLEVTPEIGDNYHSAEILIVYGGTMTKWPVTSWKRDVDSNPIGWAHVTLSFTHNNMLLSFRMVMRPNRLPPWLQNQYMHSVTPMGASMFYLNPLLTTEGLTQQSNYATNKLSKTTDTLIWDAIS